MADAQNMFALLKPLQLASKRVGVIKFKIIPRNR
jgi:hypothetical protein